MSRGDAIEHMAALNATYSGVVEYRHAIEETERLDLVTQDMLIGRSRQLELFHWFVRARIARRRASQRACQ